jgi:hypothetical protein
MACRGVHYAITDEEMRSLLRLAADGEDEVLAETAEDFFTGERQEQGFLAESDKAWDAMHRCLGDGLLDDIGEGATPMNWCVLGGRNLHGGDDYIICLVPPDQARQVAAEIGKLSKDWFRDRYFALDPNEYDGPRDEDDFEYTWSNFQDVRRLYQNAAKAGRAVVFLTDQ